MLAHFLPPCFSVLLLVLVAQSFGLLVGAVVPIPKTAQTLTTVVALSMVSDQFLNRGSCPSSCLLINILREPSQNPASSCRPSCTILPYTSYYSSAFTSWGPLTCHTKTADIDSPFRVDAPCHPLRFCALQVLVAGFFVTNIPDWIGWLRYVSFIYYCYSLLIKVSNCK